MVKSMLTFILSWISLCVKSIISKDGITSIITAMATTNVANGTGFKDTLISQAKQSAIRTGIKVVSGSEKFNLKNLGIGIAMSTIASVGAQEIGGAVRQAIG